MFAEMRKVRRILLALNACIITAVVSQACADDTLTDPKAWCGDLTKLVAAGDLQGAGAFIEKGSLGAATAADAIAALEPLNKFIASGPAKGQSFLAEKSYGDTLQQEWYMAMVGHKPVYLRCTFVKYEGKWQFANFDFDSKIDNLHLP